MAKLTQQQFDNCKKGLEILREAPEPQFLLAFYKRSEPECGTLFCSLGWLTESGQFADQGLGWTPSVKIHMVHATCWAPTLYDAQGHQVENDDGPITAAEELFGFMAWEFLFAPRGGGSYEPLGLLRADAGGPTDKELAIIRLERWIMEAEIED